ncbi:MAG: Small ribosomal subunit biogenesis GTPase RsgA [Firmicutes bacterium]|nr:Small ribosomal subunit biogenesis GTPase RsgA [candidate division NPL-UPA2 bacterium]
MVGRVVRLLAGYYFVQVGPALLRCRARGRLRLQEDTPCVGDMVEVTALGEGEGVVQSILPRRNVLERPLVANVSQVVVVAAMTSPEPNLILVDRVLVAAEVLGLRGIVFFNKTDLQQRGELRGIYEKAGYSVILGSLTCEDAPSELLDVLRGQTSVLAGQSGVGKSSLVRILCPQSNPPVGEISAKTRHGRHTTRHVELHYLPDYEAFVADTPGFSRLDLPEGLTSLNLAEYFPEMRSARERCRFGGDCRHSGEPGCEVKGVLLPSCAIAPERYKSYLAFLEEVRLQERSRYK